MKHVADRLVVNRLKSACGAGSNFSAFHGFAGCCVVSAPFPAKGFRNSKSTQVWKSERARIPLKASRQTASECDGAKWRVVRRSAILRAEQSSARQPPIVYGFVIRG